MVTMKKRTWPARLTPAPKPSRAPRAPKASAHGIAKKFLKTRPLCKVTFTLPKEAAPEAETVCVMGEFNNWSRDATPMKRRTNGDFVASSISRQAVPTASATSSTAGGSRTTGRRTGMSPTPRGRGLRRRRLTGAK